MAGLLFPASSRKIWASVRGGTCWGLLAAAAGRTITTGAVARGFAPVVVVAAAAVALATGLPGGGARFAVAYPGCDIFRIDLPAVAEGFFSGGRLPAGLAAFPPLRLEAVLLSLLLVLVLLLVAAITALSGGWFSSAATPTTSISSSALSVLSLLEMD